MAKALQENIVRVDPKGRIVLPQSARAMGYYSVEETEGGEIILHPRVVADPREIISKRTLIVLDESMKSFENDKISKPVDLRAFNISETTTNGKKTKRK